jgi:EmrB/QacA subfamily drug resistance transporter
LFRLPLVTRPHPSHAAAEAPADPRRWLGLAGLGTGVFMFTLDGSIVNVAMPTLARSFDASLAAVQWVPLAYLLVITSLVMGAARLGDLFGRKRAYLGGLGLFTAASLLCGLAPGVGWLIGFRALQGLGAVFISALGAAIVAQTFPPKERGRALGVISSCVTLGIALGPSVGGFIIELASWRWMFLVNIPVGLTAMAVVSRVIPPMPGVPARVPFDWLGTLLLAAALASVSFALTFGQRQGFGTTLPLTLFAVSAAALLAFLFVQTQVDGPILDLKLFLNRSVSGGLLMSSLAFTVLGGSSFMMPFLLELVLGLPIAQVGLLMAISPLTGAVTAPAAGALADRFGPRWVSLAGLSLMACGCLLLAGIGEHAPIWRFAVSVLPIGMGMGLFSAANNSGVMNAVPKERLSVASALLSLARTLGQSTGVPVAAALFAGFALAHAGSTEHAALLGLAAAALARGTHAAYAGGALVALSGACVAVWMILQDRKAKA